MQTLILGGGLSGLALASALEAQGHDYLLLEARDRFGGRIMTAQHEGAEFDLGPAWFWPGQPRIAALIDRLGLTRFVQFSDGIQVFEDERGQVHHGQGFASMQGSWRLSGGLSLLTQTLADRLPETRKRLNAAVTSATKTVDGVVIQCADGQTYKGAQAVFAMPPRIIAEMSFTPPLPPETIQTMQSVATWMAGQAKAIAIYDRPFWQDAGLSGDATSRRGPLVEMHDASPAGDGPAALFGFVGIPPQARHDQDLLKQQVLAQLARMFGEQASAPVKLIIKDWAFDRFTATDADLAPLYAHPTYALPDQMTGLWDGMLHFAGTEVAPEFGGYIEGALEAAENTFRSLGLRRKADSTT